MHCVPRNKDKKDRPKESEEEDVPETEPKSTECLMDRL